MVTSHMVVAFRGQDVVMRRGKHVNLLRGVDVSLARGDHVIYPRPHHVTPLPYVTGPPRGANTCSPRN